MTLSDFDKNVMLASYKLGLFLGLCSLEEFV